jgi:hypothetical protein
MRISNQKEAVFINTFKVHHLNIESNQIQLSTSAWIERSNDFVDSPRTIPPLSLHSPSSFGIGLLSFNEDLLCSEVRFRAVQTSEQLEHTPFDVDRCAFIGVAVSILCAEWYAVGVQNSLSCANDAVSHASSGITVFDGVRSEQCAYISKLDESELKQIYDFVCSALSSKPVDPLATRIITFFMKCVPLIPYRAHYVLDLGVSGLFPEWHELVLNAAVLFELIFTLESKHFMAGVDSWNAKYPINSQVNPKDIDAVMKYRHLIAHSNASDAQKAICKWKAENGFDDYCAIERIRSVVLATAKKCIRAIAGDLSRFKVFQSTL